MNDSSHHLILARSYIAYFLASIVGMFIDNVVNYNIDLSVLFPLAFICLGFGPLLMVWSQYTSYSHRLEKGRKYYERGPYKFLRNPTHLGVLILILGYALISESLALFGMTLIGFVVSNYYFKKYEKHIIDVHDGGYVQYKESVRKI